jgi:hypothetical protein
MFNLKCNHNACIADGASAMTAITLVYAMLLQELCIVSYMRVARLLAHRLSVVFSDRR